MSIGSALSHEVSRLSASRAGQVAKVAIPKILVDGKPILKLVLGPGWTDYLYRQPLAANARDVGPDWLTHITKRLDGAKNEEVGLALQLGANIPTPLTGLTLVANTSTGATLRRNPKGMLELVYSHEVDPGVAAQVRAGIEGGFTVGNFGLKVGGQAQAGVQGQVLTRSMFVYEIDPTKSDEMQALANQLKLHVCPQAHQTGKDLRPYGFMNSMKEFFQGKKALADVPPAPSPQGITNEFARVHLSQASFMHGMRAGVGGSAWGGVGILHGGKLGLKETAQGPGLDWKNLVRVNGSLKIEDWKKWVGTGVDALNNLLTPSVGVGGALDRTIEQTLDFDRGRYLQTTVAINSTRNLYANGGAYGAWIGRNSAKGHRYAVTYGPQGLKGVDYSILMSANDAGKHLNQFKKQLNGSLKEVVPTKRPHDMVAVTYTLKPPELVRLQHLDRSQLETELPRVFDRRESFLLARAIGSHEDRFDLGGWFGIGAGGFAGIRANLTAEHETAAMRFGRTVPADPLPADRPWELRQT